MRIYTKGKSGEKEIGWQELHRILLGKTIRGTELIMGGLLFIHFVDGTMLSIPAGAFGIGKRDQIYFRYDMD